MLNVSGHLMSTAEVESVLAEHSSVAEAAVVSKSHPVKGQCLYCFITPTTGTTFDEKLQGELKKKGRLIIESLKFTSLTIRLFNIIFYLNNTQLICN